MKRTVATAIAIGSALTLTGCTSHSSGSLPPVNSTSATPAGASTSVGPTAGPSAGNSAVPTTGAATSATATSGAATTKPPTAKPSPTTMVHNSTRCLTRNLRVTVRLSDRGAGQIYSHLVFTNTGKARCTLAGHPGVSYVAGSDGHQVGDSARKDPGVIRRVRLSPGGSATAVLHETNYLNFEPATCKAVVVRGLRVYPPGSTAAAFVPRPGKQCSGRNLPSTALSVGVVKAGR